MLRTGLLTLLLVTVALADEVAPLPPGGVVRTERFSTSRVCAMCHASSPRATALLDVAGRSVAPYDLWRSTAMANSARDPIWRAVVSVEKAATPAAAAAIDAKCARCHLPLAEQEIAAAGGARPGIGLVHDAGDLGRLARDGVSCSLCHRIRPDGLGTPESFTAGFSLGDTREAFGPHADPFAMPMRRHSGFTPVEGRHILDSALCGSCHTLLTDALDPEGAPVGATLYEQAPFLEWRASAYAEEASCADCHLPITDRDGNRIVARIARNPGGRDFPPVRPRAPVGRHVLVGGNALLPALLRDHPEALAPDAPAEAFDLTIDEVKRSLGTRSAELAIGNATRDGDRLRVPVTITNLTGHKLPTGHPFRRMWLRIRLRDGEGRTVFSMGETDERGRILDGAGAVLPAEVPGGPEHPHRAVVRGADEVPVWQAVMADAAGKPTRLLLRGASFGKDDRILPRGFDPESADGRAVAPRGTEGDEKFCPGTVQVTVEIGLGGARGPFVLEAELLYQATGARYLAEVLAFDTPEVRALRVLLEGADLSPARLAAAIAVISM